MTKIGSGIMGKTLDKIIISRQIDELSDHLIYKNMVRREKNENNKKLLTQMMNDELEHMKIWQQYTKIDVKPNRLRIMWMNFLSIVLGFTFVLKIVQKQEGIAEQEYTLLATHYPEALKLAQDEKKHENMIISMLDEERLQYVGAMVLGLNDALVELTGTIAGMTFALMNTQLVALSGIITGVSATLSMAASNYLAERADGNPNALKSSIYTGVAYLVTVVFLVAPYLIFDNEHYMYALLSMLIIVLLIIFFFNYYISVAKDLPFKKRFLEMAGISLSVAAISFIIGLLVKQFLGIDI